jgi:hypothetical protein
MSFRVLRSSPAKYAASSHDPDYKPNNTAVPFNVRKMRETFDQDLNDKLLNLLGDDDGY